MSRRGNGGSSERGDEFSRDLSFAGGVGWKVGHARLSYRERVLDGIKDLWHQGETYWFTGKSQVLFLFLLFTICFGLDDWSIGCIADESSFLSDIRRGFMVAVFQSAALGVFTDGFGARWRGDG